MYLTLSMAHVPVYSAQTAEYQYWTDPIFARKIESDCSFLVLVSWMASSKQKEVKNIIDTRIESMGQAGRPSYSDLDKA